MRDRDLLEAWRGGDEAAGNQLLERYFQRLFRFFQNRTGDGVEDLIQRTMLSCLENRDRLRNATSFRAYVFRLARNELYDHEGRRNRAQTRHHTFASEQFADDPSVVRIVADRRTRRFLVSALRSLPLDLQVALELHYWEGMSGAELADVLDVPVGTVKSRLRRAKEQLKRELDRVIKEPQSVEATISSLESWARRIRDQSE